MRVRRLEGPDDIRGVTRVNGLAWQEGYADLLPQDVLNGQVIDPSAEQVREWYEQVREDSDRFLVAEADGAVRGYAYFRWDGEVTKNFVDEKEAELKEIYVEPDYWRHGIGTELLEQGLALLLGDVIALKLEMLSGNKTGRNFYEKHGFKRTGTNEFEIGDQSYPTDIYTLRL